MVGQWAERATSIVGDGQLGCVVHGGGRRTARLKGGTSMVVHGEGVMVQGSCGRSLRRERCVNGVSRRWWEVTAQRGASMVGVSNTSRHSHRVVQQKVGNVVFNGESGELGHELGRLQRPKTNKE
ncbi:hypothetical protein Fot_41881 [Forsythia ovata]|uniref:Uncharacterized protein n=1 Tax=Forsythia ovata TaxID=205694 RepID=A0ABD1RNE2_9LAMI